MLKAVASAISLRRYPEGGRKFHILATGDVEFPELGVVLNGCALALAEDGMVALPPRIARAPRQPIVWDASSPLARHAAGALLDACKRLGGELPPNLASEPG